MRIFPPAAHWKFCLTVSRRADVHAPAASLRAVMPKLPLPVKAKFSVLDVYWEFAVSYFIPFVLVPSDNMINLLSESHSFPNLPLHRDMRYQS